MKKLTKYLTVALMGAVIIGCGGGGNNQKTTPPPSGSLDKSFGDNGKVITGSAKHEEILDIISNSDGTIYACGAAQTTANGVDSFLSKYSQDGNLVSSFGTNGTVFSNKAKDDQCNAMVKDSSGNIYAVGGLTDSSNKQRGYIVKYKPDGTRDTSFNGSGFLQTAIDSILNAVAMQNGKILIAGQHKGKASIARLNANGTLDSSFGNSGTLELGDGSTDDQILDIALDSSGRIIIVGKTVAGVSNENAVVARLTSNGQLDTTFGTNGVVIYDDPNHKADRVEAVTVDSSGKIIATGYSNKKMTLAKFNNDGSLDTSFASNGLFLDSNGVASVGTDLTIDANDNIVITGTIATAVATKYKMAIWRIDTTGKLDSSFNNTGIATYSNGHDRDFGYAIAIDSNDKILVGGYSYQGATKGFDNAIWRINP